MTSATARPATMADRSGGAPPQLPADERRITRGGEREDWEGEREREAREGERRERERGTRRQRERERVFIIHAYKRSRNIEDVGCALRSPRQGMLCFVADVKFTSAFTQAA